MTLFCVRQLRRLPCEVEAPLAELSGAMLAWSVVQERAEERISR